MVLRDAHLYKMVDGRHSRNLDTGAMPHHHPLPVILQFPRRVRQKPGKQHQASRFMLRRTARLSKGHSWQRLTVYCAIVLAPPNHLPLLRPPLPRPPLPRLLPPTLLPPPRGIQRSLPSALFLVAHLCHYTTPRARTNALDTLPRVGAVEQFGIYMEQAKPGDPAQFLGAVGIYGAVSAVGVDGVLAGAAWDGAER